LTACQAGEYEKVTPGTFSDRVCAAWTECQAGEYEKVTPGTFSDRVCAAWTECSAVQYESVAPAAISDRACAALTECGPTEFVSIAATTVSDRACTAVTECAAPEYEVTAPTANNDRVCTESLSLEAVADAIVRQCTPSSNYGDLEELVVDTGIAESFLRFELASIPAGATIVSVRFTMTAYTGYAYGGDGTVYTFLVNDDSWTETGITWNTKPAISGDVLASWLLSYNGNILDSEISRCDDGNAVDGDGCKSTGAMANAVQAQLDGDGLLSIRLNSPGYRTNYHSREYSEQSMRPLLEIRYHK
jgi:cysteine-rich repeat protein